MAVVDEAWLAVWWPWLLVWLATAALLVRGVVVVAGDWRAQIASRRGMAVYLDERSVMDLYHQHGGKYAAALSRQVEKRVSRSGRLGGSANLAQLQADAERGVTSEVFEKYVVNDEPISVISVVVDVLEKAHDIVDVDLIEQEVEASDALDKAFRSRPPADQVRLRRVNTFLLILGEFRAVSETADAITFQAAFGDPEDPDDGPQLRIVCARTGLRTSDLSSGTFRCLGRVERWDPGTRTLRVRAIAVFL